MSKVLVAYASKHGATVDIAKAIADKLRERRLAVCRPAQTVDDLLKHEQAPRSDAASAA